MSFETATSRTGVVRGYADLEVAEAMRDVTAEKLDASVDMRAGEAGIMVVVEVVSVEIGVVGDPSLVEDDALII